MGAVEPLLLLLLLSGATRCQPPPCPPGQRAEGDGAGATCVPLSPDGDRIIGGYPCVPMSQPWQVLLYGPLRCGAVLLRPLWVLTAAHCVKRGDSATRCQPPPCPPGQRAEGDGAGATCVPLSPDGDRIIGGYPCVPMSQPWQVLLYGPLRCGAVLLRPLWVLTAAHCVKSPGASCLLSGWGTVTTPQVTLPKRLICAYVQLLSDAACRRAYPGRITPSMLCAGVSDRRVDSCQVSLIHPKSTPNLAKIHPKSGQNSPKI
ncbi:kallikrein-8-like [Passer montanus]|uniref:kallikrein-8-like n=1 Tax=Passer montanus TaxID=9160 RepID=UPI00196147FD|nr:kallikrein-8-like [Passer montanus]